MKFMTVCDVGSFSFSLTEEFDFYALLFDRMPQCFG